MDPLTQSLIDAVGIATTAYDSLHLDHAPEAIRTFTFHVERYLNKQLNEQMRGTEIR
jgi:hypothetical protein